MNTGAHSQPSVSVALCTHNGARYLEEQLVSILGQQPAPAEIVLSDDASTDETVALATSVVRGFQEAHPSSATRLVVLQNDPPLGVVKNFEAALSACSGEFIALSDQDDVWHEGRLARALELFESDPDLLLVSSDARLVDERGAPIGPSLLDALEATARERALLARGHALDVLIRRNLVTGATVLMRRSLVQRATPFPAEWVHDEWLAIVASALRGMRMLPRPLIDYRQHGANQIGAVKPSFGHKLRKLMEPREERGDRLVRRSSLLLAKLKELGDVDRAVVTLATGKVAHERYRTRLPKMRALRVVPVLVTALRGRYGRFGRGAIDVLRDIVQPYNRTGSRDKGAR